jgi:hypothetical protein
MLPLVVKSSRAGGGGAVAKSGRPARLTRTNNGRPAAKLLAGRPLFGPGRWARVIYDRPDDDNELNLLSSFLEFYRASLKFNRPLGGECFHSLRARGWSGRLICAGAPPSRRRPAHTHDPSRPPSSPAGPSGERDTARRLELSILDHWAHASGARSNDSKHANVAPDVGRRLAAAAQNAVVDTHRVDPWRRASARRQLLALLAVPALARAPGALVLAVDVHAERAVRLAPAGRQLAEQGRTGHQADQLVHVGRRPGGARVVRPPLLLASVVREARRFGRTGRYDAAGDRHRVHAEQVALVQYHCDGRRCCVGTD